MSRLGRPRDDAPDAKAFRLTGTKVETHYVFRGGPDDRNFDLFKITRAESDSYQQIWNIFFPRGIDIL